MPWSMKDPPRPAKNWDKKAKKKCVRAANAVLSDGGSDQDAIYACIHAAGKTEHPGGEGKGRYGDLRAILTRYLGNRDPMVEVKNMSCCDDCAAKERTMEVSMAALATALKTIKAADPASLAALMDDAKLLKAVEALHSQDLKASDIVEERWHEGHLFRNPTKEQINTGPSQAASGGGAEAMVREYSSPAAQHGVQLQAEHFARLLSPVADSVKAQGEAISTLITKQKAIDAVIAVVLKKADEEEKEHEHEKEDEEKAKAIEENAAKAKAFFSKARKMLAAIEVLKAEQEDDEDGSADSRKARRAKIRTLRKGAAKLIAKAQLHALAGQKTGNETFKSIDELLKLPENRLLKADINAEHEEREEEDEEEEKAKEPTPATVQPEPAKVEPAKAKTDAEGNQADRKDPATGNQDDAAKALTELSVLQERVNKSLEGVGLLSADIKSVLDIVRGASKLSAAVPTLAKAEPGKAQPTTIELIKSKIITMAEGGDLNPTNEIAAMDILSNFELVKAGKLHASTVTDRLSRAPSVVQDLFRGHQLDLTQAA